MRRRPASGPISPIPPFHFAPMEELAIALSGPSRTSSIGLCRRYSGSYRCESSFSDTGRHNLEVGNKAETMLQQADRLLCESWNERMWSDGEPIDPSPTIDQAINGAFAWLEIQCSRCKTPSDVDLAAMKHPPTTFVHDLASRLRCRKCAKAGRRPSATLLQLAWQPRHLRTEV
jgi:hypothetical protein